MGDLRSLSPRDSVSTSFIWGRASPAGISGFYVEEHTWPPQRPCCLLRGAVEPQGGLGSEKAGGLEGLSPSIHLGSLIPGV